MRKEAGVVLKQISRKVVLNQTTMEKLEKLDAGSGAGS